MAHQRSKFDRLHREAAGQWLRLPDVNGTILADMCYFTVGSYDGTNQVITTTGTPVSLPTGTPAVPAGVKIYDRENATFSASDTGYAIRSVNVHTDGTHGQVDWVVIPTAAGNPVRIVTVYHPTFALGESIGEYHVDSPRIVRGTLDVSDDIWIEGIDTHANSDIRFWMPAGGEFVGVYAGQHDPRTEDIGDTPAWDSGETNYGNGVGEIAVVTHDNFFWTASQENIPANQEPADASEYWTKGDEITGADSRDKYKVQIQQPGVVLGMVTAAGTAASWASPTVPTAGSCTVTLYQYNEDDPPTLEVYETDVTVTYMAETSPAAGSIVYCSLFEGRWHVTTQLCAIASGYTE